MYSFAGFDSQMGTRCYCIGCRYIPLLGQKQDLVILYNEAPFIKTSKEGATNIFSTSLVVHCVS